MDADKVVEEVATEVEAHKTFLERILSELQSDFVSFSVKVMFAFVMLIIGTFIIHLIRKVVHKALARANERTGLQNVKFVEQLIKFILYAVLIIIIAEMFGVSAASVVAVLGSAGLTVGLAFQGALSNFAGGILLLIHRPFEVGDYIIVEGGSSEGKVTSIGIIYTTLKYDPRKTIVIPNGKLANCTIDNLSANGTRLMNLKVGISYNADIKKAKVVIEEVAVNDESLIKDENLKVYVDALADSSVNIGLRGLVPQDEYITAKWRLQENIKLALDANGIEIPFNQLDVHVIK